MPDTQNNIESTGIPELTFTVTPATTVPAAVDRTLSVQDQAADAKAVGDAIANLEDSISDLNTDIEGIGNKTGADIPISEDDETPLSQVFAYAYPVGSLYITSESEVPDTFTAFGTWQEVSIPMTWGDMANGTRNYAEHVDVSGNLHFFLRTA